MRSFLKSQPEQRTEKNSWIPKSGPGTYLSGSFFGKNPSPVQAHRLSSEVLNPYKDLHDACKLIDAQAFSQQKVGLDLLILHVNVRSVCSNFDAFHSLLTKMYHTFSIIMLTETWLTPEFNNNFLINGYNCMHTHRNRNGGGLRLYYHNSLTVEKIKDLSLSPDEKYLVLNDSKK